MNWAQFKDSVSHMCLAGAVVESWSLTQVVEGSTLLMTNILSLNLLNSVKTFRKNSTDSCIRHHFDWARIYLTRIMVNSTLDNMHSRQFHLTVLVEFFSE